MKKIINIILSVAAVLALMLAVVAALALVGGNVMTLFGFRYRSAGQLVLYFLLVEVVSLPFDGICQSLPRALHHMGKSDQDMQGVKMKYTDSILGSGIVFRLCRGCLGGRFCLCRRRSSGAWLGCSFGSRGKLSLAAFLNLAEKIKNTVSSSLICRHKIFWFDIFSGIFFGRGKFGKTGIQFFRIFHLGNDQNDTVRIQRDRFDHKRNIISFKTEFDGGLLHHVTEKILCFFCSVGKLADLEFAFSQISLGQSTAYLVVVYFFYFHVITSLLQ